MECAIALPPPGVRFTDGFGIRSLHDSDAEILEVQESLTRVGAFEFAVRERAARLAGFKHRAFPRVRRLERSALRPTSLAIVSDAVEGTRLIDVLSARAKAGSSLDFATTVDCARQLLDAVADLHSRG